MPVPMAQLRSSASPPQRGAVFYSRARASVAVLSCVLAVGAALTVVLACPANASASWGRSEEIVRGSAQVLEKGEIAVGIFAPLQYGLTDRITIASHPVLDLLQMLNFSLRYRIATEDDWIIAATGGFKWALLDSESTDRPFEMDLGGIFTWLPHDRVAASVTLTWSPQTQRANQAGGSALDAASQSSQQAFHNGVAAVITGHFILHEHHLLMSSLRVLRNITVQRWEVPTLTSAWISSHENVLFLGSVDVVLGVAFGQFNVRDAAIFATTPGSDDAESVWYPVIDVWKRF